MNPLNDLTVGAMLLSQGGMLVWMYFTMRRLDTLEKLIRNREKTDIQNFIQKNLGK